MALVGQPAGQPLRLLPMAVMISSTVIEPSWFASPAEQALTGVVSNATFTIVTRSVTITSPEP